MRLPYLRSLQVYTSMPLAGLEASERVADVEVVPKAGAVLG